MIQRMQVYGGNNFSSSKSAEVEIVAPGIGRIPCLECEGDPANYPKLFPPELGVTQCIDCKGRGWVYVSA